MKEDVIKSIKEQIPLNASEIDSLLEIPPNPELGDYAFPCFTIAKAMNKVPVEVAHNTAAKINKEGFEKVEAKGSYINFFLDRQKLAKLTLEQIHKSKSKYGSNSIKKKIAIESPGPNTNKPLHLGHLRNLILAQALRNISKFNGNDVIMTNINNDRGIHICKSMVGYQEFGQGDNPEKSGKKPDHFVGDYYVKFAKAAAENEEFEHKANVCLKKWEDHDIDTRALWNTMNSWALKGFKETYRKFKYTIDKDYFESDIYKEGRKIILEQEKKGKVQKKQEGSRYIDLSDEGLGEKILLRADGTTIYVTQDLYLAYLRKNEIDFDSMYYVSASEQDYHFKVLFSLLKKFGYDWADSLHHLSYGLVHLESGRMKSREGTVVDADNLIEDLETLAMRELHARYANLDETELKKRASIIAMAALRYYFLKVEHVRDITFKPEESIRFEGNTGPYILYTFARAKSILRNSNSKPDLGKIPKLNDSEKALIRTLSLFPSEVQAAYNNLSPNLIANYTFKLAQQFNEFYHHNRVIGTQEETFRLALVEAITYVLKSALSLLNIETLEVM